MSIRFMCVRNITLNSLIFRDICILLYLIAKSEDQKVVLSITRHCLELAEYLTMIMILQEEIRFNEIKTL